MPAKATTRTVPEGFDAEFYHHSVEELRSSGLDSLARTLGAIHKLRILHLISREEAEDLFSRSLAVTYLMQDALGIEADRPLPDAVEDCMAICDECFEASEKVRQEDDF